MREKLVEKQKAVDEHESNFTAGRVNVRERYLHRTGIRGRKSWIFCCVLFILTVIVAVNLVVSTLWVDHIAIPSIELENAKFKPFTLTISISILFTLYHTLLIMTFLSVLRAWCYT